MSTKPNIGWIGLGVMGSPMVFNLVSAGYPVSVFSRTKSKAVTVLEAGARWVDDICQLSRSSDIVCTMVGYPEDLEKVVLSENGVIANMSPESILIDSPFIPDYRLFVELFISPKVSTTTPL